jgi:hypothetical protein
LAPIAPAEGWVESIEAAAIPDGGSACSEILTIGMDHEVYHKWCNRADWPWMEWTLLDHEPSLT